MKRFIEYNSIKQYRDVVRSVTSKAQFVGVTPPLIHMTGTEKIHGTNAAVCFGGGEFWVQSRKNIITPEKDNAGCAFAAYQNKEAWEWIILYLATLHNIDLRINIISVYFEWCGGNIQKNSAVSGLDKRAIIFKHFKVSPLEGDAYWLDTCNIDYTERGIYNIANFPTVAIDIDFSSPKMSQNQMVEMVTELESNSRVGQQFGIDGNTGEGYVFAFDYEGDTHKFKVKGKKHAGKSKVKVLKPVNEHLVTFVEDIGCTVSRLEQAWQETFGIENERMEPTIKEMGTFLRFVFNDIIKEESDIMTELGLEPKSIGSTVSGVARVWFQNKLNEEYL